MQILFLFDSTSDIFKQHPDMAQGLGDLMHHKLETNPNNWNTVFTSDPQGRGDFVIDYLRLDDIALVVVEHDDHTRPRTTVSPEDFEDAKSECLARVQAAARDYLLDDGMADDPPVTYSSAPEILIQRLSNEREIRDALNGLMKSCGVSGESGTEELFGLLYSAMGDVDWGIVEQSHADGLCYDVNALLAKALAANIPSKAQEKRPIFGPSTSPVRSIDLPPISTAPGR